MSSNRYQKSLREIEKDFADCEKYLNKVLKRKIDKPRNSSGNKTKQNDNQKRSVKPFLTGPPSRPHSSSAGLRGSAPVHGKTSNERLIHKEVLGSGKATVEVTVKAKQNEKNHRRSLSTGSAVPGKQDNYKREKDSNEHKQSNLVHPPTTNNLSSRLFQRKERRSKSPSTKSLPWSDVLKENKNSKPQECITVNNLIKDKCHNSHDLAQHVKGHLENKGRVASKSVINNRTNVSNQHYRNNLDRPESKRVSNYQESSISGESSGFSSSIDEVEFVNKSVQCWLPPPDPLRDVSTKPAEEVRRKTSNSSAGPPSANLDTFSMFNPVRTLNFLIKELHGFVKKTEDENLRRIISDMEKALLRIPPDSQSGHVPSNYELYLNTDLDTLRLSDPVGQPLKHPMQFSVEAVARALASVPSMTHGMDPSLLSTMDNNGGKTSMSAGGGGTVHSNNSAVVFQKQLEESCLKLEAMCQEMEVNNTELRKQRDKLADELKQKNQEIESWTAKEKDYLQAISTLRTNLESSGRMMAELTTLTTQLREENKALSGVREMHFKLTQQLHDSQRSNEQLQKDIKLLQLEREKLIVVDQGKDSELQRFKKEVTDIKALVMEQLTSLRASLQEKDRGAIQRLSGLTSTDVELDSFSSATTPRRPIYSSPNSSKEDSSPEVGASWRRISSIPPLNSEQSVQEVLVLSPVKEKESFKSIQVDSEMTLATDVDDSGSNEATVIVQPKQTRGLSDELKSLFDEVRKQTKLSSASITVPSPPHMLSLAEPDGMSQWSESALNSTLNSAVLSVSEVDSKLDKGKN